MTTQTPEVKSSVEQVCLYMAFELGAYEWKLGFSDGSCQRPRRRAVASGAKLAVVAEIAAAKKKLGLPADAPVRSVYEAGRDGFWIHRLLVDLGCDNVVIDPSSLEVDRRRRRAKTDRLDLEKLLINLIRHHRGEKVWRVVRIPTEQEEDARRRHRERERLLKENTSLNNRIQSVLATQGIAMRSCKGLLKRLDDLRRWDGQALPPQLRLDVARMYERWQVVQRHLLDIEKETEAALAQQTSRATQQAAVLQTLRSVSGRTGLILATEIFAWRQIQNRRQLGALAGMVGTPFDSGLSQREQGISKAGNRRVRTLMIELGWLWIRYQPASRLSRWFHERFGRGKRHRRIGIVALARKLLIALWRFVEDGVVPEGAQLKRAPRFE